MFVEFPRGKQKELLDSAIAKAGSERRLEQILKIPNSTINEYRNELYKMNYERFQAILNYLNLNESKLDFKIVSEKDWLKRGGKKAYKNSVANGSFEKIHKKMRLGSSERMTKWHKDMKANNRESYYKLQYERFKKIGNYKYKTKRGELVRNELEQCIADFLYDFGCDYSYEPYLALDNCVYFPDFRVGNLIIESTMWRGFQKAYSLKNKINNLEKGGYKVLVVVPDGLRKYYKTIKDYIINLNHLKKYLSPGSSDKAGL